MFDNCKGCLFYSKHRDEMWQEMYDEDIFGKPSTPPHYCTAFIGGIPRDIWNGQSKCGEYVAKKQHH